jgi:hypothetical protein
MLGLSYNGANEKFCGTCKAAPSGNFLRLSPPDCVVLESLAITVKSWVCFPTVDGVSACDVHQINASNNVFSFVVYKCCPKMPFPFNFQIKILILEGHITRKFTLKNPFSNFLLNLFSIKFLYFFIISSLFPYFNLFMSIFIQSYVK